jgi:hypothetical protein
MSIRNDEHPYSMEEFQTIVLPFVHSVVNAYNFFKPSYMKELAQLDPAAIHNRLYDTIALNYEAKITDKVKEEVKIPSEVEIKLDLRHTNEYAQISFGPLKAYIFLLDNPSRVTFCRRENILDKGKEVEIPIQN